jgi:hypothetical protein
MDDKYERVRFSHTHENSDTNQDSHTHENSDTNKDTYS